MLMFSNFTDQYTYMLFLFIHIYKWPWWYLQQQSSGETELGHDAEDDSKKCQGIRCKAAWSTEVGNELHLSHEDNQSNMHKLVELLRHNMVEKKKKKYIHKYISFLGINSPSKIKF